MARVEQTSTVNNKSVDDLKKWCSKCKKEKLRTEFSKNKARKDGLQNYCKTCAYAAHRDSLLKKRGSNFENHRRWQRNRSLKEKYGITLEEFELMVMEQNNKCAICFTEMEKPRIDQDRTSGAIRALLCSDCYGALHGFNESPELLLRAVSYLDSYKKAAPEGAASSSSE